MEGNYSLAELKKLLNISTYSWKNRKEDLLAHLMLYFDYDVVVSNDNNYTFIIYQQYAPYEPLPRKKSSVKRDYYAQKVKDIVQENPYTTGTGAAREIKGNGEEMDNDAESTVAGYCRDILKNDYIRDPGAWHYLDSETSRYVPLTEEETKYLQNLMYDKTIQKTQMENDFQIHSLISQNILSQREGAKALYNSSKNSYKIVMGRFKAKYGKYPVYVPAWSSKKCAFGEFDFQ